MQPDIISYLLSLRYPGSTGTKGNWVCYRIMSQIVIPLVPAGFSFPHTLMPEFGSHACLEFGGGFGADMVPDSFSGATVQYGSYPFSGTLTGRMLSNYHGLFLFLTVAEPVRGLVTNISPLPQRYEAFSDYIIIPSPENLEIILDALRRLHTSEVSEQLQQQAVSLLGLMGGQPQVPRPPLGGS